MDFSHTTTLPGLHMSNIKKELLTVMLYFILLGQFIPKEHDFHENIKLTAPPSFLELASKSVDKKTLKQLLNNLESVY